MYKRMYTEEEIKSLAGGGGAGGVYNHCIYGNDVDYNDDYFLSFWSSLEESLTDTTVLYEHIKGALVYHLDSSTSSLESKGFVTSATAGSSSDQITLNLCGGGTIALTISADTVVPV